MITPKHILKNKRKQRIRKSIRKKISGTSERPRLVIFRSNKYLYAQVYDDSNSKILTHVSTLEKEVSSKLKSRKDQEAAEIMGKVMAERMKKKKIKSVVFDRNVYDFKGRVKFFADSVRKNGIKF
jgi:large subunit ribosomal protein L18